MIEETMFVRNKTNIVMLLHKLHDNEQTVKLKNFRIQKQNLLNKSLNNVYIFIFFSFINFKM